jgi:hypothetical protein
MLERIPCRTVTARRTVGSQAEPPRIEWANGDSQWRAKVEVIASAVQAHGEESDATPAIEPAVNKGQLGRLGLDEHRRERAGRRRVSGLTG